MNDANSAISDVPVWWYECEGCGCSLPEGVPAIVEMVFGSLPNAVWCFDCWDGDLAEYNDGRPRPVPDGGLLG